MFTHLHLHSHYSLLQALGEPKAYISKAKELGMTHLALTDYNGMYGTIEFYKYCKKAGIQSIIGIELGYVQDRLQKHNGNNIVLLAKNYEGYQQLLKLTTHANLEGWQSKARVDYELLHQYHSGLFCLIGGKQSVLSAMILSNETQSKQEEVLQQFITLFGKESVILEYLIGDTNKDPEISLINEQFIALAQKFDLTITCSPNVHFVNQDDKESYEIFLCIKEGKRIYDDDRPRVTQPIWMLSEDEIRHQLSKQGCNQHLIDMMIENTECIAQHIQLEIPLGKAMFPKYESSKHIQSLYQQFQQQFEIS